MPTWHRNDKFEGVMYFRSRMALDCLFRGLAPMRLRTRKLVPAAVMLVLAVIIYEPVIVQAQTYSFSFMVTGLPAGIGTQYYLDGVWTGAIQIGETRLLNFTLGSMHTLSVDLNVVIDNGTRYQCKENLWSITEAAFHTFVYKAQYHLEVVSPYATTSGTGWYDEGATAKAQLATNVTAGSEGIRYVFVRWEGDTSGQGILSDPIVMDHAKRAAAVWKTQYLLRISSEPVDVFPSSSSWHDANSLADLSAPAVTNGTDSRHVFSQWVRDYSGTNVKGSLQMDGPKSITATYKTQYLLSLTFTPAQIGQTLGMSNSTWHDAGSTVRLGPVPQLMPINSVERLAWFSWKVDGMSQQGTAIDISIDGPHRVELIYRTQYYVRVTSPLGETTGTDWYYSGEKAKFGVTYGGSEFPAKYTLSGWQLNSSNVIRTVSATETEILVDRPYIIEAQWSADYTPMWILIFAIVSSTAVIVAIVVVAIKRPGSLGRFSSLFKSNLRRRKLRSADSGLAATAVVVCEKCGGKIPSSAEYCQSCGAVRTRGRAAGRPDTDASDERVYDYVVKRRGEISLSRASKDLGLSVDDVKRSTERLKKKGRLA